MAIKVKAGNGVVAARPFWDSTPAFVSEDYETLRIRLTKDGYLFLRGVLPSEDVNEVRCRAEHAQLPLMILKSTEISLILTSEIVHRLKKQPLMIGFQVCTGLLSHKLSSKRLSTQSLLFKQLCI